MLVVSEAADIPDGAWTVGAVGEGDDLAKGLHGVGTENLETLTGLLEEGVKKGEYLEIIWNLYLV